MHPKGPHTYKPHPEGLLCLADDLTGAAELATLAAGLGARGPVVVTPQAFSPDDLSHCICFVNLGCRQMTGPEAGGLMRKVIRRALQGASDPGIFLKIDSAARSTSRIAAKCSRRAGPTR